MSTRLSRPPDARPRALLGGWCLLVLFLHAACATGTPPHRPLQVSPSPVAREALTEESGLESAHVYELGFLEPGDTATRPVPMPRADFQRAFARLSRDVRLGRSSPRQAARELLGLSSQGTQDVETLESQGDWLLEAYADQGYTLVPERQQGPVALTPVADDTLKTKYLAWCEHQGGGDCLGLLDDGPYLRTDDRYTLALALAFGHVLDETRAALVRELLDVRAVVSMVVWTVALYCMMWVVPEPLTKALAATLTVLLMSYLGLHTVYGLMDGWARLATTAHHATTFEELRAAGEDFGKLLGEDAARAMILAVTTLGGHTLGQVAERVKSLPGFNLAASQWEAQGGAAALGQAETTEGAFAMEGALAKAVATVEAVATSPQGPLAVVMLKKGASSGVGRAPGGRTYETVLRHRGGNRQVELSDGQRWHLPRGKSVADIPVEDKVGDMLQQAVLKASNEWGPDKLSRQEKRAIKEALDSGEYWLAQLLEREARGRFVQREVKAQFEHLCEFSLNEGIDVVDPTTGRQYEILSGTASNMARHGRRMANELFRMLTF